MFSFLNNTAKEEPVMEKIEMKKKRKYYRLNIFIKPDNPNLEKYKTTSNKSSEEIKSYLLNEPVYFDSGYDLYNIGTTLIEGKSTYRINHDIRCSMELIDKEGNASPVGYYLYLRSSTGLRTPLRLANSVGVIDSGYRGDIIAIMDNIEPKKFTISPGDRLVQICPPNLSYPTHVNLVDSVEALGKTERGEGGLGSTGK